MTATDERLVTVPLAEVAQVYAGFWICLLCAKPGMPGFGRYWSDDTYAVAAEAALVHLRSYHSMRETPVGHTEPTMTATELAQRFGVALSTVVSWRTRNGPDSDRPFPRSDAPRGAVDYWYASRWPEIEAWRLDMLTNGRRRRPTPFPPDGFVTASGAGVWIGKSGTWVLRCAEFPKPSCALTRKNTVVRLWGAERRTEVQEWYARFAPRSKSRTVSYG